MFVLLLHQDLVSEEVSSGALVPLSSSQVYAQSGDRAETQHGGQEAVHPGPQRQDLPLPGHERRVSDGVAQRGAGAAAAAPAQPLLGEEEGDHKETFVLHRYSKEVLDSF